MSSLALAAMLFPTLPAHAGHWRFSAAGTTFTPQVTGNKSPSLPSWTVPPGNNGSMSVTFPGVMARDDQNVSNPSCSCMLNASISVTATWTHDTGQTDANDPTPTSVWIIENSAASWQGATNGPIPGGGDDGGPPPPSPFSCSGSASDGVPGDQQYSKALPLGGPYTSGSVTTPAQTTAPPAPAGWSTQPVNGKTFTITRSLSANGTAGYTGHCSVSMSCSLGPYTIKIHAQPYGLYDAGHLENGMFVAGPHMDNTTGELAFSYGWYSTSGSLDDLKGITIYEIVDYSGTPGTLSNDKTTFFPQSPPVTSGYNVPNGKAGAPFDASQLYAHDVHSAFPTVTPLQPLATLTWNIPQKYEFDDPATGEVGTILKDMGNIVDMLQINPNQFTVSKSGFTAKKPL